MSAMEATYPLPKRTRDTLATDLERVDHRGKGLPQSPDNLLSTCDWFTELESYDLTVKVVFPNFVWINAVEFHSLFI